jgi:hypothetical protein
MTELNQDELDVVSGAGMLWDHYVDVKRIHGDLVKELSDWMLRTFG